MKLLSQKSVTAIFAVTNFLLLSHFSKYRFDELQSYNWDIALMLTPYGIVKNLLSDASSYLEPYYFVRIQVPPDYSFFPAVLFILVQVILSASLLMLMQKRRW